MKKKIILPLLALAVVGAGLFAVKNVSADEANTGPMSSLVAKIADKFGLNKDEVQAVFDEDRTEREADRQKSYEEKLSQLVVDGKLTEDQKNLIIAKNKELEDARKSNMESMKSLSDAERKSLMEKERLELETWAKDNGIDIKYLMGGFGKGGPGGRGFGGHGGSGGEPIDGQPQEQTTD